MSNVQTIEAAYAAFANNDPSVLFGAMAPDIHWHEAEGIHSLTATRTSARKRLAKASSAGCWPRLRASPRCPIASSTAATTSSCWVATAAR